jgi:hypothetical protein
MGTNKANPAAMILSSTMMLRHLGLESLANSIAQSTFDVINEGKVRTADMGGKFALALSATSALIHVLYQDLRQRAISLLRLSRDCRYGFLLYRSFPFGPNTALNIFPMT